MTAEKQPQAETVAEVAPVRTGSRKRKTPWLLVGLVIAVVCVVCLVVGATVGYLAAGRWSAPSPEEASSSEGATTWTCSMHPQIKLPKQGKCPICFMDLIPLEKDAGGEIGPRQLRMSKNAVALAKIRTTPVKRQIVTNEVRMVGKIDYDETRVVNITAWVAGRLDRLYVDYTGITVREGDHLVYMYSPDLIVAQRELLQTWQAYNQLDNERDKELVATTLKTVEEKLRLLGIRDEQIKEIKQRGTPSDHLTIYAPVGGIVIHKHANEGVYVQTGTKIYTIADLSQVWVYLDAYESDVPWLRYGQEVEFTSESYPGEIFKGRIAFIDPVLNQQTRTVRVRVNVSNDDRRLKPGMFVRAVAQSRLAAGGRVLDASLVGKWICPMHPEIVKDGPSGDFATKVAGFQSNGHPEVVEDGIPDCDICGMDLVPAEELGFIAPKKAAELPLVIPVTAALITGKRAVVYVKLPDRDEPIFEGREVLLGQRAGDYYIVRHGLAEGEEVVTAGNFKIDSELQIKAKSSMMNPQDTLTSADQQNRTPLDVPGDFRVSLDPLLQSYLTVAKSLAADDLVQARRSVHQIHAAVEAVDIEPLDSETQSRWKKITDQIIFAAYETTDAGDRDTARRHFSDLSKAMLWLVQSFGHALPEPIYHVRCRMALDYKGADWLQLGEEIANPYFGTAMPRCGEQVATFKSQAPLNVPDAFRRQLTGLYDAYLQLQEALADDRLEDARAAWPAMQEALEAAEADVLDDRARQAWQQTRQQLQEIVAVDLKGAEIDQLRQRFEAVSTTMLGMIEAFGHFQDTPLSKVFCSMAFDNKGAAWLQAGEKIANPYFGHKMLRCGEIKRTFAAAAGTPAMKNPVREALQ